jgi:hypothetical protein
VKNVDNGGSYTFIRGWGIWEISVPPSQFHCETKTLKKVFQCWWGRVRKGWKRVNVMEISCTHV